MNDGFREFIDELLNRTDVVQVISRYVPLKQKGNTHWGCCPFNHEKDPSFAVNQAKQFYHCFGCKESGNAITFVQKMESVDFIDAVRILAEAAHMEVPQFKGGKKSGYDPEKKKRLYELMKDAARHYHENLSLPQAEVARQYLEKRGIDAKLTVKFGLGYSLNGGEIIDFLTKKGYAKAEMKEVGIIEQRADSYYDVFYGRLIFPIIDNFRNVVAFGGRTLKADYEFAKYRNSSQTPIFDKSRNIYGINLLKKKKQRENFDSIIMTEGYMDVIALHKGGFDTAVASMGTALTPTQAKLLKNYADRVYISYDGDGAGQKATMRGLDILEGAGLSVRVVSLPEGMDPDDVIKKQGAAAYKKLLDEAETLTSFKIKTLKKAYDLTDSEGKAAFAKAAVDVIRRRPSAAEQEEYINLVQSLTGYSKHVLMKQAELLSQEEEAAIPPQPTAIKETRFSATDKAALCVLASLAYEKVYAEFMENSDFLPEAGAYRSVYEAIERYKNESGTVRIDSLFSLLDDEGAQLLHRIADYEFIDGDERREYLDCLRELETSRIKEEMDRLNASYAAAESEQKGRILKQIGVLSKRLKDINSGN